MKSKRLLVLATVIAVIVVIAVTVFYLGWVRRVREIVEQDGWLLQYTYIPRACRLCGGRVERLECKGHPLPFPQLRTDRPEQRGFLVVATPVGTFERWPDVDAWRFSHGTDRPTTVQGSITDDELARGYYNVDKKSRSYMKEGIPAHWCWACTLYECRWLDPQLLDDLDWQDTDPDWQDASAQ